ncbi:hypothetical protein XENOCAPTIV_000751, partial [Xenoophorus captivus]
NASLLISLLLIANNILSTDGPLRLSGDTGTTLCAQFFLYLHFLETFSLFCHGWLSERMLLRTLSPGSWASTCVNKAAFRKSPDLGHSRRFGGHFIPHNDRGQRFFGSI